MKIRQRLFTEFSTRKASRLSMGKKDGWFKLICGGCAAVAAIVMFGFFIQLAAASSECWKTFGLNFLISTEWNPAQHQFGALPAIVGTLLTTAIALILALPPAFAVALYLSDARACIGVPLGYAVDLLAAIPSVIYGMWGLFVLAELMQKYVQPLFSALLPFLSGPSNGFGIFSAGVILALMILPYICAIMRDVFRMTPAVLRESAYGIGCTRFEAAKDIVFRYGIRGILGGVFIGLGRALGETMAVLFVIGNRMEMPRGIFDSGSTIASTLANHFAEADGLQRSVLFALGLVLLVLCFSIQILAQYYLHATGARRGEK